MPYPLPEDSYLPLSALQHFTFCPRQCALIHTDCEWAENVLTTFGALEHKRVHTAPPTTQRGLRTARGIPLVCHQYGIRGESDAVEYIKTPTETRIIPIEYKHGKRDNGHGFLADCVQLCAQVLCLEEMNQCVIPQGYLYYKGERRRTSVPMTQELRNATVQIIEQTRDLLQSGVLPPADKQPHCKACSLIHICLPTAHKQSAARYNDKQIQALLAEPPNA